MAEILMNAQRPDDPRELCGTQRLEPDDVDHDDAPQPWLLDVLKPDLEARYILLDLLDEGQVLRQVREACVRFVPRPLNRRRTGRDENCIEDIVLGAS